MGIWKNIGKIISLSGEIIILWTKEQMKYITPRNNKQYEKITIIPKKTHNEINIGIIWEILFHIAILLLTKTLNKIQSRKQ